MITVLRWLAIPLAMFAGWWLTIFLGIGLLEVAIRFCPAEDMVSGMCVASWYEYVEDGIIAGCAGVFAAFAVAVSVLLAPAYRPTVASVVLGGGVVVALYMAYASGAWGSFAGAVLAGVISWSVVQRRARMAGRGARAL